jgi:UPF0755 protein
VKSFSTIVLAVLFSLILAVGFLLNHVYFSTPARRTQPVEVRVEQGDSLAAVVRKLREQNVITNERLFSLWARLRGVEKRIHRGLYRFEASVTPQEVLDRLVAGKGIFQSVTIPEGLTVREIADLLAKLQIVDKEKFIAEAADPELLAALGLREQGIEGYLFPSTYHFIPATPEKDIIITMAEQFRKVTLPVLAERDGRSQLTPHEIITLASIIEKETGIESERPLVSAVFHNRLRRQIPMQSDPTVIYGLKDFNGNLTRKDLQDSSPYNTYRIAALPPGPICNPSLSSVKAALFPADVPYLYFVSKNDGTHIFSETLDDHNQAVKTFQPVKEAPNSRTKVAARRR